MNIYKIVFSPTGGTEKVADTIANAMGSDIYEVDLSDQDFKGCTIDSGSIAVIAMPSFGGRAPGIAIERLRKVNGIGSKAVVIAVYGNREQEDTLIEMVDTVKECGFETIAGIAAVAEHSIAHQYAAGRPDEEDKKLLQQFAQQIMDKITGSQNTDLQIPGNHPYKKAGAGIVPKTSSACVNCGLCASKCPVAAIDKQNPKQIDKSVCINCMRCISVCPKKAKSASPVMVKMVGIALKKACSERKENILYI